MIDTKRTAILSCVALCTGLGLASPALAHDGPHQLSYLQSLLHELAWADTLAPTPAIAAVGAIAAWRFCRRKAARTKL
jgi:hydrogenase/urease accessory protein HupE